MPGILMRRPPAAVATNPCHSTARDKIIDCAFDILERIGIAGTPDWLLPLLRGRGANQRDDGRVLFPRQAVERALRSAPHEVVLHGYRQDRTLEIGGGRVHVGTGGAAVQTLDAETETYRDSTLKDLYQAMRVLDGCEHVSYGVRLLVARDMPTPMDLDINTAFACLKATTKPIGISFDNASHVAPVCRMFDIALGAEDAFHNQAFCMAIIVHAGIPPALRCGGPGYHACGHG